MYGLTSWRHQARLDRSPVYIGKKSIDVTCPFGRFIVQHERVFPYIHDQHWNVTGDMSVVVQCDPYVHQLSAAGILIADRPTHTTHFAYGDEIFFPGLITSPLLLSLAHESRTSAGFL